MRRIQIWSALAFSLLIMVGCKSTGSGTGASNTGDVRADEGMKGGGEGQCQLSSGQNIRADFPPS